MSNRQTHWTIDSPQGLEGMQNLSWKGEWPFFIPLHSDTGWEPLWVEVPFDFVRRVGLQWWLDIRLDCGGCGTGLYVTPISPWARVEIEEAGPWDE